MKKLTPLPGLSRLKHCLSNSTSLMKLWRTLEILSILTNGDGVYFYSGNLLILWDLVSWCTSTAAYSEVSFALQFRRCTAGLVLRASALAGHALHGWEELPLTDTIRFGDLVERFPRPNGNADNILWSFCNMIAGMVEIEAKWVVVGNISPWETLTSQNVLKCLFKLLTWARVDDGIDAAV